MILGSFVSPQAQLSLSTESPFLGFVTCNPNCRRSAILIVAEHLLCSLIPIEILCMGYSSCHRLGPLVSNHIRTIKCVLFAFCAIDSMCQHIGQCRKKITGIKRGDSVENTTKLIVGSVAHATFGSIALLFLLGTGKNFDAVQTSVHHLTQAVEAEIKPFLNS
jgi:hypothetical protein